MLVCHNTEASLSLVQDKAAKAAKKQAAKDAKQAQQVGDPPEGLSAMDKAKWKKQRAKELAAEQAQLQPEPEPEPKATATGVEQAQQDAKAQVEDAQVSTDNYPSWQGKLRDIPPRLCHRRDIERSCLHRRDEHS